MSAEVLWDAAAQMRTAADEMAPPMTPRDAEFITAVAGLLDRVAADYGIAQYGYWSDRALSVARAYLGTTGATDA